jgi:hypothetical protein
LFDEKLIRLGMRIADSNICDEDRIWSRYSNDKVNIGIGLARIIRVLNKVFPLNKSFRALSIGSSAEPQFRILDTAFRGGLYLLDIDEKALDIVRERIDRQCASHVSVVYGNYKEIFLSQKNTQNFVKDILLGKKVELITLHHSLYYSRESEWEQIFENLYRYVLAPKGAMHTVLMSAKSNRRDTSTWLYNHFANKFCGCHNNQDLYVFCNQLKNNTYFRDAEILIKTDHVRFCVNDFSKLMAVVWMILLYPDVHKYTKKQREEITRFICKNFWKPSKPLIQAQDHMAIYRGIGFNGVF